MKQKRGLTRYYERGDPGLCPDCDGASIVYVGSVLGELARRQHRLEPDTFDRLMMDLTSGRMAHSCRNLSCKKPMHEALWIEQDRSRIQGPFCAECFESVIRGVNEEGSFARDRRVFTVRLNDTNLETIQSVHGFYDTLRARRGPIHRVIDPDRLL